jgi:hypothetical protein
MMQQPNILDVVVRDHVADLRRQARQARLAAKARRHTIRLTPRSR